MRAAARAIQAVFAGGFLPAAVEVADRFTLEAAREFKPGASFPRAMRICCSKWTASRAVCAGKSGLWPNLLRERRATAVETATTEAACERLWDLRRAFSESLKATGLKKLNEDVVVPRGKLVDLIEFAQSLQRRSGFPVACFGHAGDGNIHVNIMVGEYQDAQIHARADAALDELFSQIIAWGGAITGEHGIGLAKKPWWNLALSEENRALHGVLKHALDPKALLNPGKFV